MPKPQAAPCGSWKSPITSDLIVAETIGLGEIMLDGADIYWIEARPAENGRNVLVRWTHPSDGRMTDVTLPPFNVRTRVHEYGGGAFAVMDGVLYFSNLGDSRLYRQAPGSAPQPLTPAADLRYADGVIDPRHKRMIWVREDHTLSGREAVNTLVCLPFEGDDKGGQVIVSGNDFYSSPCLNLSGSRLAWLSWNHPNMPWDGTELWVGELGADGSLGRTQRVAGGVDESVFQPGWSPDGTLYFVSDRNGWWNLYRWCDGRVEPLCEMEAEFGRPQWAFRFSTFSFESAGRIICTFNERGVWKLGNLNTETRQLERIETPYTEISSLQAAPGCAVFLAGSPTEALSIVRLDLATRRIEVLRRSEAETIDGEYLSYPQAIEFPTEGGLTAHAFFYPPRNRDYVGLPGERPPLLVMSHGGPTSAALTALKLMNQYWTSRGFALLDVNYGGSNGYGRAYRRRLNGQWGVVDVDDCVNAARYLVERGEVDGNRLAIRGGSAGGYTTLCALTFRNVFKAGASHFGICDLEAMVRDTHKFESRYLDSMIGPYPERRDLYLQRSPIYFTDRLSCPMILFQGLDDKVVPPNQAEMMYKAVRAKWLPVALLTFEGEEHGFRRAENIKRTLEAELYFYGKVFGFDLADPVEPVLIENL